MPTFNAGDIVKCVGAAGGGSLLRNQTYTILKTKLRPDGVQVVMVDEVYQEWWRGERFVLVTEASFSTNTPVQPPKQETNVDVREERFRAMLTTTTDPYTCKKCGAPKATCNYH